MWTSSDGHQTSPTSANTDDHDCTTCAVCGRVLQESTVDRMPVGHCECVAEAADIDVFALPAGECGAE